jgi:TrpR-related protein YerC/YecD
MSEDAQRSEPAHAPSPSKSPSPSDLPAGTDALVTAMLSLPGHDELARFMRDLCTLEELQALSHRWQIALLLEERLPYLQIAERLGTSTTTVTRVAHWLRHGAGGYRLALERVRRTARRGTGTGACLS